MCIRDSFLNELDHLPTAERLSINMLSYAKTPRRRRKTLEELNAAGVFGILNKITFTTQRTSEEGPGQCTTEKYSYPATFPRRTKISYQIFAGGKEQYIRGCHDPETHAQIMFVDDNAWTLKAAHELMPCLHVTEMRRHYFRTDPRNYKQVRHFDELREVIGEFAA